jgi:hypothetical protein
MSGLPRQPGSAPGGAKWLDLYSSHIEYYATMPEFTRDLAEAGFRRKVDNYLHHHLYLCRRSSTKTGSVRSRP